MTDEKELATLIKALRSHGAVVDVEFDGDGYHKQIKIKNLNGVTPYPIAGMIHAAEVMRDALHKIEEARVDMTLSRLIRNIPEAIEALEAEGKTNLAGQIQRDIDNLTYWQNHGGLQEKK